MPNLADKIREAIKGDDKPKRQPFQSGPKVINKSREEGRCAAGDEAACERLRKAQSTDDIN